MLGSDWAGGCLLAHCGKARTQMHIKHWMNRLLIATVLGSAPLQSVFATTSAEIITIVGKGDRRQTAQADWEAAAVKQAVPAGSFVRTRDLSQMALLLPDRTQLRLNQNSQLQIKTLADAAEWQQSTVRLNAGRAWSQARPPNAPAGTSAPSARVMMETPSATLSIRGTDWEVEVAPDGRTQLVVLSGVVDISNDFGALKIGAGETAVAEVGKAPVRLLLANPADRVQWVTAWQLQPRRWIRGNPAALSRIFEQLETGDYPAADQALRSLPASLERDLLLADLATQFGDVARARDLLAVHARDGAGSPVANALLARLHLARGDPAATGALLDKALAQHRNEVELWLASAELAVYQGEAARAHASIRAALEIDTRNAHAWYLQGLIETERENVRAARAALMEAQARRPGFDRAKAESGILETLADNYADAFRLYEAVLSSTPDDYVALSGRGLLKLKTGDPRGALNDFLRAGVIEPRYARAWLYSAATFYQLGEANRASEALAKAIALDPRDPVPHVLASLIAADGLSLGAAIDAAREAQARMPFAKSLNQVQNNQKGSANVGSALAAFGMEAWARHYATSAYSPWWAGSHLFLADRQVPGFNKNSELFKGFITDPTVFGASQRTATLVQTPGHHGRVELIAEQAEWRQDAFIGTANGMLVAPVPTAYFFSGDVSTGKSRLVDDAAHGQNYTLGLGARPGHALGLFLFSTDTSIQGHLDNPTLPTASLALNDRRSDLGVNFKINSRHQLWLKSGSGSQSGRVKGEIVVSSFGQIPLDRFSSQADQSDTQLRHAWALTDNSWISWGYEDARQNKPAHFDATVLPGQQLTIAETTDLRSRDAYAVARFPLGPVRAEAALFRQRANSDQHAETRLNGRLLGKTIDRPAAFIEMNWRTGLQWALADRSALTWVNQRWRRPASVGSLAPIDTLGIAVNDRLTSIGGFYQRTRLQLDWEATAATFVHAFLDRETVKNVNSPSTAVVPDLQLDQLESLRNRRDVFTAEPELEKPAQFLEGQLRSGGLTLNQRLTPGTVLSLQFRRALGGQTGVREGLRIPYVPRDYLRLTSQWSLPQRWLIGVTATWRSERFRDEANSAEERIQAGWSLGLTAYWESADKRWVVQGILDNLRSQRASGDEQAAKAVMRVAYMF